jgi:hypothetical protein
VLIFYLSYCILICSRADVALPTSEVFRSELSAGLDTEGLIEIGVKVCLHAHCPEEEGLHPRRLGDHVVCARKCEIVLCHIPWLESRSRRRSEGHVSTIVG